MAVSEWERRELCPDGACTGLIGPEGTCKVCGRAAPNWGEERKRGLDPQADADEDDDYEDDDDAEEDPIAPGAKAELGEWKERKLCPDGACIGVIGDDGKCRVCGKRAVGRADDDDEDDEDGDAADYDEDADEDADEGGDDDEEADNELAAAADELAGVASSAEVATAKEISSAASADEDDRKNCPDGACIGLIGADGKCKVCGKEEADVA